MMMVAIRRLYLLLVNALAALAGVLILASVILVIADVTSRAMGYGSFRATIAIVEYILIYFTLFSAPYLLNTRGHVLVDMVITNLSGLARKVVESIIYLIGIVVCSTFVVVSISIMQDAIRRGHFDERSIDLPYWLLYAAYPLCFGLLAIEFARLLFTNASLFGADIDAKEAL